MIESVTIKLIGSAHHHGDDQSETSSARSSNSGSNNSLKGSGASSPCYSPSPSSASPSKMDAPWNSAAQNACRYFIVKASNNKILQVSEQKGVWATSAGVEKKLDQAFRVSKHIVLFSLFN
jgi:YT521-B-like domain